MSYSDLITSISQQHGLDPEMMLRIGQLESGLRSNAQNPNSSAGGLFQFIDSTWNQYAPGQNRMDARANTEAAARFTNDNVNILHNALGRDPEPWEVYLAHQQGADGAVRLLSNPNAPASDIVGRDAVRLNIPANSGVDPNSATAQDFASFWQARYNRTSAPSGSGGGGGPSAGSPSGGAMEGQENAYLSAMMNGGAVSPESVGPQEPDPEPEPEAPIMSPMYQALQLSYLPETGFDLMRDPARDGLNINARARQI